MMHLEARQLLQMRTGLTVVTDRETKSLTSRMVEYLLGERIKVKVEMRNANKDAAMVYTNNSYIGCVCIANTGETAAVVAYSMSSPN